MGSKESFPTSGDPESPQVGKGRRAFRKKMQCEHRHKDARGGGGMGA